MVYLPDNHHSFNFQSPTSADIEKLVLKADGYVTDQFSDSSYVKRTHPEHITAISEYVKESLKNPEFKANPQKYMENWNAKRAILEMLQMQDNVAYAFFQEHVLNKNGALSQKASQVNENISSLIQKAERYVADQFPGYNQDSDYKYSSKMLIEHINQILSMPNFSQDPKGSLKEWLDKNAASLSDESTGLLDAAASSTVSEMEKELILDFFDQNIKTEE